MLPDKPPVDVIVTPEGECPQYMALADLLAADDGLRDDEAEIRAALDAGETYRGGGGAAPEFTIERIAQ